MTDKCKNFKILSTSTKSQLMFLKIINCESYLGPIMCRVHLQPSLSELFSISISWSWKTRYEGSKVLLASACNFLGVLMFDFQSLKDFLPLNFSKNNLIFNLPNQALSSCSNLLLNLSLLQIVRVCVCTSLIQSK